MKQFTATVYIVNHNQILLIYHKKLKKWLPPGGHIEPDELPSESAIREAKEETGLDVELIRQENMWIESRWNCKSFERPFMCLIEEIPACGNEPAHQHVDFIYIGKPTSFNIISNFEETEGIKWFTIEEIRMLKKDIEIFSEVQEILELLLTSDKSLPSDSEYVQV